MGFPETLIRFHAPESTSPKSAWQALLACHKAHPGKDILLLESTAKLPPYAWERLSALQSLPGDVVSPLSRALPALNPFAGIEEPSAVADADAMVFMLSEHETAPVSLWSPACAFWRASALVSLSDKDIEIDGELPVHCQATIFDGLYVSAPVRTTPVPGMDRREQPALVASLGGRIKALHGRIPTAAGRGEKPVVLHVLHGWGGGVHRFVNDLMKSATAFHHLALVSQGSSDRQQPGEVQALHDDLDAAPLSLWPLSSAISATALESSDYQAILHTILTRYRVSHILLSSLIGHSLDVLNSGRPCTVVCHDYYPFWPLLHENFDDPDKDFSADALGEALSGRPGTFPFAETRPAYWKALRERYVTLLCQHSCPLICPSKTVQDNIQRIEPRLKALPWHVIPHALAPWPVPVLPITPPARKALRVVVTGRINGGKGEELLASLIPLLDPRIELILLGAGHAGMRFFGSSQVHIRLNYRHDELPQLLHDLAPDLALIPATVSETFSYTLSELWSLGVPVLATRLGSLAERIEHGVNGLLAAANAESVAHQLNALLDDREALALLRTPVASPALGTMVEQYESVISTQRLAQQATQTALSQLEYKARIATNQLAVAHFSLQQQHQKLQQSDKKKLQLQKELDKRAEWAQALESELNRARQKLDQLHQELDSRTEWAFSLQRKIDAQTALTPSLQEEIEFMHKQSVLTQQQLEQIQELLSAQQLLVTEHEKKVQQLHKETQQLREWLHAATQHGDAMQRDRDAILASRSWRLTRPLRAFNRIMGRIRTRLVFRHQRICSLLQRTLASLRNRGVQGTVARIRDELRPSPLSSTPAPLPVPQADVSPDELNLPVSDTPVVSIVIPVYNHLDATLVCLQSLASTRNRTPHEIIVVDDCSSDASAEVLPTIPGLHYQRNAENKGFIGACNAGAESAHGEFVLFLNNDTAVQDGWLDALVDTFEQHRDVGLVGSKLVYPDGRLQEAGGIVFADGSGWNYGRLDDPNKPEYNYVRDADYCSGAAILLRTELFRRFGGFDTHYAPAYYEDTDLAMKVRQAGLRVLYQPASVVVHFEGISSGTDTTSGTKRYQVINKEKFFARWKGALAQHPSPALATHTGVVLARQHRVKKRVLVIDATTPQPDHDSGSVRLCNILRLFREEGCAVTFFADNRAFVEGYTPALQQMGIEVLYHPYLGDPVAFFEERGKHFDLIFISRHYIASNYLNLIRTHAHQARFAFDTVDLHYLREQRAATLANSQELARTAEKTREQELTLIRDADVTLVVSPVEKELLATDAPGAKVDILSNVHEVFGCRRGFLEREGLMFVGGYQHPPNVDAALWFAREIFPLIRKELPEVVFHLIGSKAPAEVKALGDLPGVKFHGFVESIEPFLDACRVAVAPLRYGAGVKGKVNMSMSYGQPVVATPIATEGMFAEAGRDVLVAETPEAFAAEVVRVYRDRALWEQLSANGLTNVTRHFSFESARHALQRLLD